MIGLAEVSPTSSVLRVGSRVRYEPTGCIVDREPGALGWVREVGDIERLSFLGFRSYFSQRIMVVFDGSPSLREPIQARDLEVVR